MKRMLKLTNRRWTVNLAELLPLGFLAASLLSCAGLRPFPVDTLYEYDAKEPICGEYKIVDVENLKYAWVRDIPLKDCPSIFGFTPKQIPKVLSWARDAKDYARAHCN